MLKRKEVEQAFLGIMRSVKEDSEGMEAPEESITIQSQSGIRHYLLISVQSLRNLMMSFLRTSHLDFLKCAKGMSLKLTWRMTCPRSIALYTR